MFIDIHRLYMRIGSFFYFVDMRSCIKLRIVDVPVVDSIRILSIVIAVVINDSGSVYHAVVVVYNSAIIIDHINAMIIDDSNILNKICIAFSLSPESIKY